MPTIDEVKQCLSYASQSNIDKLTSIKAAYSNTISNATIELNNADFSGWEDSISSKLSTLHKELTSSYSVISSEVDTGNLATLVTLVQGLKSKCEEYKGWYDKKYTKPTLSDEDKAFYNSGQIWKMSQSGQTKVNTYNSNVRKRKSALIEVGDRIDEILRDIKALTFSTTGIATDGISTDFTPLEIEELTDETSPDFVEGGLTSLTEEDMYAQVDGWFGQHSDLNQGKSYYVSVDINGSSCDAILTFNGNSRSPTDWGSWSLQQINSDGTTSSMMIYGSDISYENIHVYQTPPEHYGNATAEGYASLFGNTQSTEKS